MQYKIDEPKPNLNSMTDYQDPNSGSRETRSRSKRWKHRLRRNKSDRPISGRRTLKQTFRDYRAEKKGAGSSSEKHYSIRRWKNKNRKSLRDVDSVGEAGTRAETGLIRDQNTQPRFAPKIHYREQASTESFLFMSQMATNGVSGQRFASLQFEPIATAMSRSKSAPVTSPNEYVAQGSFEPISLPRKFPADQSAPSWDPKMLLEEQSQHAELSAMSLSGTGSTVSTKIATEPRICTDSTGNGVMKRLEASVLSFFSFAIPKNNSEQLSRAVDDKGLTLPFFRNKNSTEKSHTSLKNSREQIDYSIYGSQAKYFI